MPHAWTHSMDQRLMIAILEAQSKSPAIIVGELVELFGRTEDTPTANGAEFPIRRVMAGLRASKSKGLTPAAAKAAASISKKASRPQIPETVAKDGSFTPESLGGVPS
ncbi:hypothetical protein AC578_9196 [Pseudocercospora eumusae]|uniref:Uncharacterized protein n=1 Tax=Pseudocercospora eumusae TaxID=321146 RepID=A0A139HV02_9PEZI|nr:hypothetical protein AC578_9196 [Pseudocercospora eumusae]